MPNTTSFEFGHVVLVQFPFTNQQASKQRPAVVISNTDYNQQRPDVILMAITSQIRHHTKPESKQLIIGQWESAGLLKPSAIKPIIFTAEKSIVRKILGKLNQQEMTNLQDIIHNIIGK